MTKILTVTGFKGGVGKSTLAVHLAAFLSSTCEDTSDVLLVDADPNRTIVTWDKRGPGLPCDVVTTAESYMAMSRRRREWVIFDTPARPGTDDLAELAKGCDLLILPTTPDVVSILPMLDTARAIEGAHYCVVLTIVPPAPMRDGEEAVTWLREERYPLLDARIRRTVATARAALDGVTVRDLGDKSLASTWADYEAVGREIRGILT